MSRSIEVELSDFDDDDIIEEIMDRGLAHKVFASEDAPALLQDVVKAALADLMANRTASAEAVIQDAIKAYLPPQLWAAWIAIRDGRRNDAICELDDILEPGPSASKDALRPVGMFDVKPEETPA